MNEENMVMGVDFGSQNDSSAISIRQGNTVLMTAFEGEPVYNVLVCFHDTIEAQKAENKELVEAMRELHSASCLIKMNPEL